MSGVGGQVDGGRELAQLEQKQPLTGSLFRRVLNAINTLATNTATSATGESAAPAPPASVAVKVSGELMHVSINHPAEVQRNVHYFTEIGVNDPSFAQPIVYHHGTSRTPPPINLPTKNDTGVTHSYSVRSFAQYLSSQPSKSTLAIAGPFTMTGTTQMTLLPSNGSGTAPNTGQNAGQGYGKIQVRKQ